MLSSRLTQFTTTYNWPFHLVLAGGCGLLLGGAALWFSPLWVLGALIAIFCIVAVLKRPELALLAIVSISSTILAEAKVPLIALGGVRFYITDLFLFGLFGLIILRSLLEPDFKLIRTPLDWPLLIFYGVALVATVSQLLASSQLLGLAISETRTITYYLTFFAATNLIREKRQLNLLLQGVLLLATGVAIAMIIQFTLGDAIQLLPGRVENLATEGRKYSDITRIIPPGESLILAGFIAITVILVLDKPKPIHILKFLQWALLGVAVILTFNRNFWVSVGLVLLFLFYLLRGADRQRLLKWSLVVIFSVAMGLVITAIQPQAQTSRLVNATVARLVSLVDSKTYEDRQSSTLRWRDFEYHYALPQIIEHPLLGLGLGAHYRPFVPTIDYEKFDGRGYTHNAHIWIILKTGLLGYLCLIWLSFTFLRRGFQHWRDVSDPFLRGIVLSFTLTYLGVMLGSLVNPMLMEWFWTPVIGLMFGISEVILARFAKRQTTELMGSQLSV